MRKLALTLTVVGALGACSGQGADDLTAADRLATVRETVHFQFIPFKDPGDMLRRVDVAVVGTVASVDRAAIVDELDGQGAALVAVQPQEVWKRSSAASSGLVYYLLNWPKDDSIDPIKQALPEGSKVVLFGSNIAGRIKLGEGRPGGTVYEPVPEGLWLEAERDGIANVWGEESTSKWTTISTVEELRASLGIN
jgi:hypothetical protein